MERFTFSKAEDGRITATDATKQAFGRELARSPGAAPRAIVNAAAFDLGRKAKELSFMTGKSYESAARFLMEGDPWLRVAQAAIAADAGHAERQMGIFISDGNDDE